MLKVGRALRVRQLLSARRPARLAGWLLAAAALAAAAGCGLFDKSSLPPCPPVSMVADTAKLVKFRPGPGRDLTDVEFEAELADFQGKCDYDKRGVNIDVTLAFTVARGPALQGQQLQFDYFVAIPRYRPAEAGKRIFTVAARFDSAAQRGVQTEEVSLKLPIKPEEAESYEIYLGLQLTPDQVEFNRAHRAK